MKKRSGVGISFLSIRFNWYFEAKYELFRSGRHHQL